MLITYMDACVLCARVCGYPGEGIVAVDAMPNPFLLNKICLNQAVVQVMAACMPSPCVVATSEWYFGYVTFHIP